MQVESVSLPLESGLVCWLVLTNRMQGKWHCDLQSLRGFAASVLPLGIQPPCEEVRIDEGSQGREGSSVSLRCSSCLSEAPDVKMRPSWQHSPCQVSQRPHEWPGQYHVYQKNRPTEPSQFTESWEIIKCDFKLQFAGILLRRSG